MEPTPKRSAPRQSPPAPGSEQDSPEFKGEVLGMIGGSLVAHVIDVANPDRPVEVEVLGGNGFYARCMADQVLPDLPMAGRPAGACGLSLPLPDDVIHAGQASLDVIVAGTLHTLPHKNAAPRPAAPVGGAALWQLFVHRLYWDSTGKPAPADTLAQDAASIGHDVVGGTAAVLRRISRAREQAAEAAAAFRIEDSIVQAYRGLLGRNPEGEAYQIYVQPLRNGMEYSVMLELLIDSPEFRARWTALNPPPPPDPDMFNFKASELVEIAYRAILCRDPEPAGYEIYGNAIRNGYKMQAFLEELIATPEFRNARSLYFLNEHPGTLMATSELGRLSASMERAVLTLAMGAALGSSDMASLLPRHQGPGPAAELAAAAPEPDKGKRSRAA